MSEGTRLFAQLVGKWEGAGKAMFPTIKMFDYTETLVFSPDESRPLLHYEQRTYKHDLETNEHLSSHWESGFIRLLPDDMIELLCSQSGGRVEVMDGRVLRTGDTATVELASRLIANDPRMARSTRIFKISDQTLSYSMSMITEDVSELTMHLDAMLKRAS